MKKGYLFAFISIFLWSTVATAAKLLLGDFNNFQVLFVSSLFAALSLAAVYLTPKKRKLFKTYRPKDYLVMSLIGMPGIFLYYVLYFGGADGLPANQAFIINYMWPIMSVVFACLLLKESLTPRKIIAILLSFLGIVIVTGGDLLHFDRQTLLCALLCLLAAVCYGAFTALNRKYSYDVGVVTMLGYLIAVVLTGAVILVRRDFFTVNSTQVLGFIWNGVFTMAIPNALWVVALRHGGTAKISNLAYVTPFLSMLCARFVLGEPIRLYSVIGLTVIVLGIFIQLKPSKKKETGNEPR